MLKGIQVKDFIIIHLSSYLNVVKYSDTDWAGDPIDVVLLQVIALLLEQFGDMVT